MPLPSAKLIPDGWEAHHRPVAAGGATKECTVKRSNGPAPYGQTEAPVETVWAGKCRLQQHNVQNSPTQAGQPLEVRRYLLVLVWDDSNPVPQLRTGEGGDVVHVAGSRYRIAQRLGGSLLWEHDFIATEVQTQEEPV